MKLSVIVPCYNEIKYIQRCAESLAAGLTNVDYDWEMLIIDGRSDDGTREILQRIAYENQNIRVLDNPRKFQVHGLNVGLKEARGEIIIRCDAHSQYPHNYLRTLVALMDSAATDVGNIGTPHVCEPGANTELARCISVAMGMRAAVGASHRSLSSAALQEVDTLLFGCWRREIFDRVGLFDERFIRGQDLEHNCRIRAAGLRVLLYPGEPFIFFTRATLKQLGRMVYQYAAAKIEILTVTGVKPPLRGFVPFCFFLVMLLLLATPLALALPLVYVTAIGVISIHKVVQLRDRAMLNLIRVLPAMHVSHAAGCAYGLCRGLLGSRKPTRWSGTRANER
ncbi:glycosyltransferase family 2 protein [Solimonas terrae]|uniref:Glycosyltransferase family 2 protein n=1 Tax=Solimonas terrae TaxID=1396819 RepID=A0A6M2BPK7_9GAMM|nr:glycosyltransferase family 2 protein [Solimonas terrae]NGY04526.1 glycosyltransferase family 2 protein [Solimonas terrae]